jgi:ketosteroid isomerase-like protein
MKQLAIVLALICLIVSPLAADCSPADKKALEDLDRAWGESSIRGDRPALEQLYASDYMNLTPGDTQNRTQTIDGTVRDAERARLDPQPPVTHDYYIIQCTPNTASITHRNVITSDRDGKKATSYSRSVHFLEKRSGRWQVVSNAGNALSDSAAVLYLEHEWNDADMKGDSAWFDRHFASNMSNISSRTGKFTTKNEEIAAMKSRKDQTTWAELSDLAVRSEGDTHVVTGVNAVKGRGEDGKSFDRKIAFTDVWVKRNGEWQVLASQGTEVKN